MLPTACTAGTRTSGGLRPTQLAPTGSITLLLLAPCSRMHGYINITIGQPPVYIGRAVWLYLLLSIVNCNCVAAATASSTLHPSLHMQYSRLQFILDWAFRVHRVPTWHQANLPLGSQRLIGAQPMQAEPC